MTALSDLRVVDLSIGVDAGLAGAFCAKMFADFGADVIKVEPPNGDPARKLGPFPDDSPSADTGGMFTYLNTNKRGVTIDLDFSVTRGQQTPSPLRERAGVRACPVPDKGVNRSQQTPSPLRERAGVRVGHRLPDPDGLAQLQDLCATADVVVETFAPNHVQTLGIGYDDLARVNPGGVLVSITPFGQTGPWRDYQATDLVSYAASGQSYVNGSPDREPLKEPGEESGFQAGACAFLGAMTALAHRDMTGEGQHVDVSIQEAAASAFSPQILGAMHSGHPEARGSTPLLPCKDGYVSLNVRHDATWEYMWLFFDDPDVAHDPRFATAALRRENAAEIERILLPHLARHTMEDLFHGLAPLRLLIGMTLTIDRLLTDPHLAERDFFIHPDQLKAGHANGAMPGPPFKMSATPWTLRSPAPKLGQHNPDLSL